MSPTPPPIYLAYVAHCAQHLLPGSKREGWPSGDPDAQKAWDRRSNLHAAFLLRRALNPFWGWSGSPLVGWTGDITHEYFRIRDYFRVAWEVFEKRCAAGNFGLYTSYYRYYLLPVFTPQDPDEERLQYIPNSDFIGTKADWILAPLEDPDVLEEVMRAGYALMKLIWDECLSDSSFRTVRDHDALPASECTPDTKAREEDSKDSEARPPSILGISHRKPDSARPTTGTVDPTSRDDLAAVSAASGTQALAPSNPAGERTRRPRTISKLQKAIVVLEYRAQRPRESLRVEDIAIEANCTPQNLYKSPRFMRKWDAAVKGRKRHGWKIEGVADCPDDSTIAIQP